MKLNPKVLAKLKKNLPPGFGQVLKERLEQSDHQFSAGYIYRVINPEEYDYNELIIDEAIAYLNEIRTAQLEKEEKILALTE